MNQVKQEIKQTMNDINKKENKKKNRFLWGAALIILVIYAALIAGVTAFRYTLNKTLEEKDETSYGQYYVMICDNDSSSFWQSVYEGAYEQGIKDNAYVEMLSNTISNDYSKEELMRIAIASGVDGIILNADESEEMTSLINEASAEGIPVVTLYNDNTHSNRCSFVGVGSYNLGKEYARQVLKILNGPGQFEAIAEQNPNGEGMSLVVKRIQKNTPVEVAVLVNSNAGDSSQNILCSGIQDTLMQEKDNDLNINLTLLNVNNTNPFSAEESIRNIFAKEMPDIIICLNERNTICAYQTVVDYNRVGKVEILGYYDSDTILNAIDRHVINSTVSIDTAQMGRYCVEALKEYHSMGNTSQYFTADVTLIDQSNVKDYTGFTMDGTDQTEPAGADSDSDKRARFIEGR